MGQAVLIHVRESRAKAGDDIYVQVETAEGLKSRVLETYVVVYVQNVSISQRRLRSVCRAKESGASLVLYGKAVLSVLSMANLKRCRESLV